MNRIRELRKERNMNQTEFAKALNVHQTAVSQWETEKTVPDIENMKVVADYFGVSLDYLLCRTDDPNEVLAPHVSLGAVRVPVLGVIPAGIPIEAIEDIIDWEEIPQEWARGGREFFGLKISGDSMSPRYESGDVVIFRRTDVCENGQDCAVMVNSDDATFKRVKYGEKGMMLVPLNPEYETRVFSPDEVQQLPVRVVGVAVQIRRDI